MKKTLTPYWTEIIKAWAKEMWVTHLVDKISWLEEDLEKYEKEIEKLEKDNARLRRDVKALQFVRDMKGAVIRELEHKIEKLENNLDYND